MAGYTRQDIGDNISNGSVIDATYLDQEFNAVEGAFDSSTGHTHDGSAGEGAPIEVTGPNQEYVSDASALAPKTDGTYTLGKDATRWSVVYSDQLTVGDGDLTWNSTNEAVEILLNSGVTMQVGQQVLMMVHNQSGSTISKGEAVKYDSAIGSTGFPQVSIMSGADGNDARLFVGLAAEDIASGSKGFVVVEGIISGIDTSSFTAADVLYVAGTAGTLIATKPTPPAIQVRVGFVVTSNATTGSIYVKSHVSGLANDKLVRMNSLANGDILVYNSSNSRFENGKTLSGVTLSSLASDLAIADGGTGASTAAQALINFGLTATAAELNKLDGVTWDLTNYNTLTATAAELNKLDGVTWNLTSYNGLLPTVTELNYVDGVTSNIQTQLNGKQASDAGLTSIAGLTTSANKTIYTTGSDTYATTDLSAYTRSSGLLAATDLAGQWSALHLGDIAGKDNIGFDTGVTAVSSSDGTQSSGTYTPSPATGNFREIVNGGAFTFAAPSYAGVYTVVVEITNNSTAGAITFSGFSKVIGDGDLTTTDTETFQVMIVKTPAGATASVVAMQ